MNNIDVTPYELGDIGECVARLWLHKHLILDVLLATVNHLFLELGSNWYFIGRHMHLIVLYKPQEFLHAAGHVKLDFHLVLSRKGMDALVVIAQSVALEDEKACRAVDGSHDERVGEVMLNSDAW